ncbi:MAG: hypothetical protein ILO36_08600 [Abditibacteriota bacterium]|nr:hypothetical protein [Abditibacteriota bacterium]
MIKGSFFSSVSELLRICIAVLVLGLAVFAFAVSLLFAAGFAIGCLFCLADLWLLAFMVSRLSSEEGLGAGFAFLFTAKTLALFGALALCVYVLSRLSMPMFWGFLAGLLLIPAGVVLLLVSGAVKRLWKK